MNRLPVLYLSTSAAATSFTQIPEDAGAITFLNTQLRDTFDIACPNHTTTQGSPADRHCRVVFTEYGDRRVNNYYNPTAELRECTLNVDGNSFSVVGCTGQGFGAPRGFVESLTDYGTGAAGQRQTRSWLMSMGERSPHNFASARNSNLTLWNHNGNTFAAGDLVSTHGYTVDRQTCTAMESDDPKTYFGGSSLDYCEDCQRLIRLDWGQFNATGVPSDKCW